MHRTMIGKFGLRGGRTAGRVRRAAALVAWLAGVEGLAAENAASEYFADVENVRGKGARSSLKSAADRLKRLGQPPLAAEEGVGVLRMYAEYFGRKHVFTLVVPDDGGAAGAATLVHTTYARDPACQWDVSGGASLDDCSANAERRHFRKLVGAAAARRIYGAVERWQAEGRIYEDDTIGGPHWYRFVEIGNARGHHAWMPVLEYGEFAELQYGLQALAELAYADVYAYRMLADEALHGRLLAAVQSRFRDGTKGPCRLDGEFLEYYSAGVMSAELLEGLVALRPEWIAAISDRGGRTRVLRFPFESNPLGIELRFLLDVPQADCLAFHIMWRP